MKPRMAPATPECQVIARVNGSRPLLAPPEVRWLLLTVISRAQQRFHFDLRQVELLDHEVTLTLELALPQELPAVMRWILGVFSQAYNRTTGDSGHFWGGRYRVVT